MKSLFYSVLLLTTLDLQAVPPSVYEPVAGEPFWLEADVAKQFPSEPVIRSSDYVKQGSTYFVSPGEKATASTAWIEAEGRWLEGRKNPATSKSDNMVLAARSANVEVTAPDGKVVDTSVVGAVIPQGSTVSVKEGWAAVTMGDVNTLHLMPNTTATLDILPAAGKLTTTVNLKAGGVFSKVGKKDGLTQDYRVKTPLGVAAARGTDYVTLALPTRMEVWIAEGVVDVLDNQGKTVGQVAAANDNALKVLRHPSLPDPADDAKANAAIMTAAFGFVGEANIENKAIQAKKEQGLALSAEEQAFQSGTIPVKFLIKVRKTN